MPTLTPNFSFYLPLVNNATDQDLWGGYLNSNFSSLDTLLENVAYPVGSIYINMTNSANPSTILGFGTWASLQGVVLVGAGTGTDSNSNTQTFTANTQVGEYKHQLTVAEMPSHNHTDSGHSHGLNNPNNFATTGSSGGANGPGTSFQTATSTANIQNTGGGGYHNNVQPSIGAYMWYRTA